MACQVVLITFRRLKLHFVKLSSKVRLKHISVPISSIGATMLLLPAALPVYEGFLNNLASGIL